MKNIAFIAALAVAFGLPSFVKQASAAETKMRSGHSGHVMGMHQQMAQMNKKMVMMLGKSDAKYDLRFIDMMIPHHEGAILMHPRCAEKCKASGSSRFGTEDH